MTPTFPTAILELYTLPDTTTMPTSKENLENLNPTTPPTAEEFISKNLELIENLRENRATFEEIHTAIMTGDNPPKRMTVETLKTNYYRARRVKRLQSTFRPGVLSLSKSRANRS